MPTTFEFHTVDDGAHGRLEADVVAASNRVTRSPTEDDQDALADSGTEGIHGDHGFGLGFGTGCERLNHEQAQAFQRRILLSCPNLPNNRSD